MKRSALLALIIISPILVAPSAFGAQPKPLGVCTVKDQNTVIKGKTYHCAVIPSKWATTKQMVWQDINQWSMAWDKVFNSLNEKGRYQFCLVDKGAPLPGKKGTTPPDAIAICSGKPAPSLTVPPKPAFAPDVTNAFLSCLSNNGWNPPPLNQEELIVGTGKSPSKEAVKACINLAPDSVKKLL